MGSTSEKARFFFFVSFSDFFWPLFEIPAPPPTGVAQNSKQSSVWKKFANSEPKLSYTPPSLLALSIILATSP